MSNRDVMNSELIQKARSTNLAQYLATKGEKLVRNGSRYKHKEHDSLVFTNNTYYWNSKSESGNAIDFVMSYYNMPFEMAVRELTGNMDIAKSFSYTEKKFSFDDIAIEPNMHRTIAYLNKSRCIHAAVIQKYIKEKLIFQEAKTNNAVLPIYDENNKIVGAETFGTLSDIRYKGVKEGSKYGYGFNIKMSEQVKYALFFESSIDLLSFVELEKASGKSLDGCLLVSLMGLKKNVVENTIKVFSNDGAPLRIVLCVDNDEAGKKFCEEIKKTYPIIIHSPHEPFKDWNEQLKDHKERITFSAADWKNEINEQRRQVANTNCSASLQNEKNNKLERV